MSQPVMILNYNETKTVTFQPKTASGVIKNDGVTAPTYNGSNLNLLQITPDPVLPFTYTIKNTYANGGGAQINFSAVNELGATVTDSMGITLVAADPVTNISHVIS
jgi:hypothetical protein